MHKNSNHKNGRAFVLVLLATFVVWILISMSESKDYPRTFQVHYTGYDTARYALLAADPFVSLSFRCNGFEAFRNSFGFRNRVLDVDLSHILSAVEAPEETYLLPLPTTRMIPSFEAQLNFKGISPVTESLQIHIAQRCTKMVPVLLRNVDFSFSSGIGIAGELRLEPDSVRIYGSTASLAHIHALYTAPAAVANVEKSQYYKLDLDPNWKRYPDLRVDASTVQAYIPVETYTENSFTIPVRFVASDTKIRAKLYPYTAEISFWVPEKDFGSVRPEHFIASVNYHPEDNDSILKINISRFPSEVRIKSIKPEYVHYVVIK